MSTTAKEPAMRIRKARTRKGEAALAGGWIVHDHRDPDTLRLPPWVSSRSRVTWGRYPTWNAALRAALRALAAGTPLRGYIDPTRRTA